MSRALMTSAPNQYIIIAIATSSSKSLSKKMIKPSIYVHKKEVHIMGRKEIHRKINKNV